MARGWEGKSVEAQQEAAAEDRRPVVPVSREDAARRAERDTLKLAAPERLPNCSARARRLTAPCSNGLSPTST